MAAAAASLQSGSGENWKRRIEEVENRYEDQKKEAEDSHERALAFSRDRGGTNRLNYLYREELSQLEKDYKTELKKLSDELNNSENQAKEAVRKRARLCLRKTARQQAQRRKRLSKRDAKEKKRLCTQRYAELSAVTESYAKSRDLLHAELEPSMSRADQQELSDRTSQHQSQMSADDEDESDNTPWKQTIQTCKFGGVTVTCTMYQGVKQDSRAQWVSEELITLPGVTERMIRIFTSLESTPGTFQEPPAHGRLPGTLVADRSLMKAFTTKATWSALVSCKHAKTMGTMSYMHVHVTGSLTQQTLMNVCKQLDLVQPLSPLQATYSDDTVDRVTHATHSMNIDSAAVAPLEESPPHSPRSTASDSSGSEAAPDAAPEEAQQALCSRQEDQCEKKMREVIEKCFEDNGFPVAIINWVKLD